MLTRICRLFVVSAAALAILAPCIRAEEGMWTFDNPPGKQLEQKYNFSPTKEWLDHLRLASVRLNDGGSGSFVSPNGLLLTNHHVARGQLQKNSTAEHDYLRDGFYATSPDQEMKSPDLEVNVLVNMQDVTARVQGAAKSITDNGQALNARQAEAAAIEKESKEKTGLRSDVVSLYNGGQYWLYQYKAYTDVRLVFAPEQQAAFYGGDPDNFTYPRYDLDMAIFRVYGNGKPLHTENYLKWNANGAAPGDLIFISGHPGTTQRQYTMAQLLVERDLIEPVVIEYYQRRIAAAQAFAAQGPEESRLVYSTIFGLQNSLKVFLGRRDALSDKQIVAKKQAEEDDFRAKVAGNPEWQKEFGNAWDAIGGAEEKLKALYKTNYYHRTDSRLFALALQIVQYAAEIKKPDAERLPGYHDAGLESLRFQMLSPAPISASTEKLFMKFALNVAQEKLGQKDEYVQAIVQGRPVDSAVDALVDGTKIGDPVFRKALIEGGEAAVALSKDPMIAAARRVDPISRTVYLCLRDSVTSVLIPAGEKLGKARFLAYGTDAYPDATFTLRLSFGTVAGYEYNGTVAPSFTTFYGLYDRAASFSNRHPFDLSPSEEAALPKLRLTTPFNFASTGDIIGGNSGSPVVDRKGDLVGLIFDGNIESLAGDFVYDGSRNRAVAVHSAGMIEGLRKIYRADALADELQGK